MPTEIMQMQGADPKYSTETGGFRHFALFMTEWKGLRDDAHKREVLEHYLLAAEERDILRLIILARNGKTKSRIPVKWLTQWCMEITGLPEWLVMESRNHVGDLAETIALLLPDPSSPNHKATGLDEIFSGLETIKKPGEEPARGFMLHHWNQMDAEERILLNKIVSGTFRINIPHRILVTVLSAVLKKEPSEIAHNLAGEWVPARTTLASLFDTSSGMTSRSKPIEPAIPRLLEKGSESLGDPAQWLAEWAWTGTRAQLVKRGGDIFLWNRHHALLTDQVPDPGAWKNILPDGLVLDGIIRDKPGNFSFIVFDLLEYEGADLRNTPLDERRKTLQNILESHPCPGISFSPGIDFTDWAALESFRQEARATGLEGIILKSKYAPYPGVGSEHQWWKWKPDDITLDAVLVYAQRGDGGATGNRTTFTFAVRNGDAFTGIVKTNTGLSDVEIDELDEFVRSHTVEKFGPVRTVTPLLVFEIAFEGISASKRHKSGLILQSPRVSRWKKEQSPAAISTLQELKEILLKFGR